MSHPEASPLLKLTPPLMRAAEEAAVALARYDERLARIDPGLAAGALRRAEVADAQALVGLGGGIATLEDIVLNDAGMDVRTPTSDVVRAVGQLGLRRAIERRDPKTVLQPSSVLSLLGLGSLPEPGREVLVPAGRPPWLSGLDDDEEEAGGWNDDADEPFGPLDPDDDVATRSASSGPSSLQDALAQADALLARTRRPLASYNENAPSGEPLLQTVRDPLYGEAERLTAWFEAVQQSETLPATCASAVALDRWLLIEPSERNGEAGFLLAAALLRRRGLTGRHLPALARSFRRGKFRWSPHQPEETRIAGLLAALQSSAELGQGDIDRLSIAQELLMRRCAGRSRNSRLPALAALFIASPLVTVQAAAKSLSVSPQAIEAMLKELGPSLPRELTGRRRYRAWGII